MNRRHISSRHDARIKAQCGVTRHPHSTNANEASSEDPSSSTDAKFSSIYSSRAKSAERVDERSRQSIASVLSRSLNPEL